MPALTIGLLSDTHIPHRLTRLPGAVLGALAGVDLVLHAGDVDDPAALEPLRAIAPVHAVRGNVHLQDFSDGGAALPTVVELQLAGQRVVLTHGHRPGLLGFCFKGLNMIGQWLRLMDNGHRNQHAARRLARLYPAADIIVFGHSHRAHVEWYPEPRPLGLSLGTKPEPDEGPVKVWAGRTLLVNPGAVCPTRREQPTVARMRLGEGRPEVEIVPLPAEYW